MPLHALEPRRLYRQIADQVRDLIRSGEFARGERLPSEREIAVELGVSRTSVREALIALEIGGFVEVRGGSGIYVTADPPARAAPDGLDPGPGPFELLRARWFVEGETAALAAKSIAAEGLAELRDSLAALESSDDYGERDVADRVFHLTIAAACGNSVLAQTVRLYWDMRRGPMWKGLVRHFHRPAMVEAVVTDHRRILDALEKHDAPASRLAMRRHLERVEREFVKGKKEVPSPAATSKGSAARRASPDRARGAA